MKIKDEEDIIDLTPLFDGTALVSKIELIENLIPHTKEPNAINLATKNYKYLNISFFIDYLRSLEKEKISYQDLKNFAQEHSLASWSILGLAGLSRQKAWADAIIADYAFPRENTDLHIHIYSDIYTRAIRNKDFASANLLSQYMDSKAGANILFLELNFFFLGSPLRYAEIEGIMTYLCTELQKNSPHDCATYVQRGLSDLKRYGEEAYKFIPLFLTFIPEEERVRCIKDLRNKKNNSLDWTLIRTIEAKDYDTFALVLKKVPQYAQDFTILALKVIADKKERFESIDEECKSIASSVAALQACIDKKIFEAALMDFFKTNQFHADPRVVTVISTLLEHHSELFLAEMSEPTHAFLNGLARRCTLKDSMVSMRLKDFDHFLRKSSIENFRAFLDAWVLSSFEEDLITFLSQKDIGPWVYNRIVTKIKASFSAEEAQTFLTKVFQKDKYKLISQGFRLCYSQDLKEDKKEKKASLPFFLPTLNAEEFKAMLMANPHLVDDLANLNPEKPTAILDVFPQGFEPHKTILSQLLTIKEERDSLIKVIEKNLNDLITEKSVWTATTPLLRLNHLAAHVATFGEPGVQQFLSKAFQRHMWKLSAEKKEEPILGYYSQQVKELMLERLTLMFKKANQFPLLKLNEINAYLNERIKLLDKADPQFTILINLRAKLYQASEMWVENGDEKTFCDSCHQALSSARDSFQGLKNQSELRTIEWVALSLVALGIGFVAPLGLAIPLAIVSLSSAYLTSQSFFSQASQVKELEFIEGQSKTIDQKILGL